MTYVMENFAAIKSQGKKALIPFFTAGYPTLSASYDFARMVLENGADMLELGVPFSDPMADGPAIQFSSQTALDHGIEISQIFDLTARLKKRYSQPIILMGYYNPVHAMGLETYLKRLSASGGNGLIIPDLPVVEGNEFRDACRKHDIATIFLAAPTSNLNRIKLIEKMSTGFVYAVSVAGITGARKGFSEETHRYFRKMRNALKKPFVVGFGVSSPKMAADACCFSDGIVIGSAFVGLYRNSKNRSEALRKSEKFLKNVRKAI